LASIKRSEVRSKSKRVKKIYVENENVTGLVEHSVFQNGELMSWSNFSELNVPRAGESMAAFDGTLWVVGGVGADGTPLPTCERYNCTMGKWEVVSTKLRIPRTFFGLVVHHGNLVALGGEDQDGLVIASVEYLSPSGNEWKPGSSMLSNRSRFAAVVTE